MAALLGIEWPVNSVGVLPDVDPTLPGYLLPREGDETLARAALVNAQVSIMRSTYNCTYRDAGIYLVGHI